VVPIQDFPQVGRGPDWQLGRIESPRPFFYFLFSFLFSFSCFMICFIIFANVIQIQSNKFLGPSNIHYNVLK
jgi:hypothetical protein